MTWINTDFIFLLIRVYASNLCEASVSKTEGGAYE